MNNFPTFDVPSLRWPILVRFFHWTSVLLLVAAFVFIQLHENTEDTNYVYLGLHKAVGVAFLMWVVLRLFTRAMLAKQTPKPVPAPQWVTVSAAIVHTLLYILMLLIPFLGFVMSQMAGYSVNMFGLFEIPVFLPANEAVGDFANELHTELLPPFLMALTAAHVLAAVYHQILLKDKTINRML